MAKDTITLEQLFAKYSMEDILYKCEFEEKVVELESALHRVENPKDIAMGAISATAEFYDGDWCGIIDVDLDMAAWRPILWYNRGTHGMTETRFRELENTESMEHWWISLSTGKPVIIPDTSVYRETNPEEYEVYSRCLAKSILAVPFGEHPLGFLIIRNPKRYQTRSSFAQVAAYVAFSSVTEMRLLERAHFAYSPEQIKNENDVIINLFGGLEIYTSTGRITEEKINSPKFCRIIAYLLLNQRKARTAKELWDNIWMDCPTENAGENIRQLHKSFRDNFSIITDKRLLITTALGYQFNPELNIMTDFGTFDEYLQKSHEPSTKETKIEYMKKAEALYAGDLFPNASGEHWILQQEYGYKLKYIELCEELMKIKFEEGNYRAVQYYVQRILRIERNNYAAYYWSIKAYRSSHQISSVKKQLTLAKQELDSEEVELLLIMLNEK